MNGEMDKNLLKILEMRRKQLSDQEKKAEVEDSLNVVSSVNHSKTPSPVKKDKVQNGSRNKIKPIANSTLKTTPVNKRKTQSSVLKRRTSDESIEKTPSPTVNKKAKVRNNSPKNFKSTSIFQESPIDTSKTVSKRSSQSPNKKEGNENTNGDTSETPQKSINKNKGKKKTQVKSKVTKAKSQQKKKSKSNKDENIINVKEYLNSLISDSDTDIETAPTLKQNTLIEMKEVKEEPQEEEFEKAEQALDLSHSVVEGKKLFEWLIHPVKADNFFGNTWEKKPLHLKRKMSNYYQNLISTEQIDHIMRTERLDFTKNLDITSYADGKRETHNPIGRALPAVVWDFYMNGCSIRILNPQTYIPKLHLLCATLQEFFGCMVGTNSYLTPPNSQGFAPHYDDIEAFVVQVEGKKHWKLYAPRQDSEILPRTSSMNFTQEEIGQPILEVTLNPGDLLYFPRGTIHQATTVDNEHSLHVTISVYQKHSWADLLEKLVPGMISTAVAENKMFREGLPLDISNHLGLVHSDRESKRRVTILSTLKEMINKLLDYAPYDAAVDQLCKEFQHSAMPPVLSAQEEKCTLFGDGEKMKAQGVVVNRVELTPDTKIRLLRANIIRMVMEDEAIRMYYYIENTKEYQAIEPQYMEVEESQAPAIEYLILSYPNYVSISDLPLITDAERVALVQNLWEKGVVMTSEPLEVLED